MNQNTDDLAEREEIEMLLPWYVTGRLDPQDVARVEAFLAEHPEQRRQLDLIRDEQAETIRLNEAIPAPSAPSVDVLLARVGDASSRRQASPNLLARVARWWALRAGGMSWAAAAAAGLVLIQAAVIALLLVRQDGGAFQTASGPAGFVTPGSFAIVRFADTATADEIIATLTGLDMTIADGPKAGGLFSVRIGPETMSDGERAARIAELKQDGTVVVFATSSP
jgi:anti-sigma factor RsiW